VSGSVRCEPPDGSSTTPTAGAELSANTSPPPSTATPAGPRSPVKGTVFCVKVTARAAPAHTTNETSARTPANAVRAARRAFDQPPIDVIETSSATTLPHSASAGDCETFGSAPRDNTGGVCFQVAPTITDADRSRGRHVRRALGRSGRAAISSIHACRGAPCDRCVQGDRRNRRASDERSDPAGWGSTMGDIDLSRCAQVLRRVCTTWAGGVVRVSAIFPPTGEMRHRPEIERASHIRIKGGRTTRMPSTSARMPTRRSQYANRSIRVSHRVFVEDSHSPGLYERIDRADRPVRVGFDGQGSSPMAKGPRPWAWRAEPHGGRPVPSGSSQRSRPTTTPLQGRGGSRRLAVCSVSPTEQAALDLPSCQLRALEQAVVDAAPVPFRPNPLAPIRVGDYWIVAVDERCLLLLIRSGQAAGLCKRVGPAAPTAFRQSDAASRLPRSSHASGRSERG
jgi:hypothetical protein